ncbi:hypothetical protein PAPYR_3649 [Paratrimastix pyriformis]|uniref:Uncharacterized protein n=1 Tax=Paratrimastix pyriformis TaxID=342808 RepID=A0ABQ8UP75_9EUKA|nr:hypothetical protein PAPYR_3649 [Paratrimastix pyriformis]
MEEAVVAKTETETPAQAPVQTPAVVPSTVEAPPASPQKETTPPSELQAKRPAESAVMEAPCKRLREIADIQEDLQERIIEIILLRGPTLFTELIEALKVEATTPVETDDVVRMLNARPDVFAKSEHDTDLDYRVSLCDEMLRRLDKIAGAPAEESEESSSDEETAKEKEPPCPLCEQEKHEDKIEAPPKKSTCTLL